MTLQLAVHRSRPRAIVRRLRRLGIYTRRWSPWSPITAPPSSPGSRGGCSSAANAGWILRVPLFVKLPGQRRGQDHLAPGADDRPAADDRRRARHPDPLARRRPLAARHAIHRRARTHTSATGRELPTSRRLTVRRGFRSASRSATASSAAATSTHSAPPAASCDEQLRGARRIEVSVESPGGTTVDPERGLLPLARLRQHPQPRGRRRGAPDRQAERPHRRGRPVGRRRHQVHDPDPAPAFRPGENSSSSRARSDRRLRTW